MMSGLIDTAIGTRDYLNAGQLLFALPREAGLSRVRARFRRLATSPGFWSPEPVPGLLETCNATLIGTGGARRLHFMSLPDRTLKRGGDEAPCEVRVTALEQGPLIPRWVEAEFEGAVWSATIRLSRLIGPAPGSGRVWLPVTLDGAADLLDPVIRSGRIRLDHTRDRIGVHLLKIRIDGRDLMEFGVTVANLI